MFAEMYIIEYDNSLFWTVIAGMACVLLVLVPAVVLVWSLSRKQGSPRED
jgi:hypothetical protein